MANYLTTKNRLLVAMLAFILPFSFARAEAKKDGKTIYDTPVFQTDGVRFSSKEEQAMRA